uniref:Aminoglycoside phosphotransferase domain-containing protein n=1 Tax=Bionectria ochroleuca TaxID=29856 RepID=A0A8H7K1C6_BIOOC
MSRAKSKTETRIDMVPFIADAALLPGPLPTTEAIASSEDVLKEYPGRRIVRIGEFVIKYSTYVSLNEGHTIRFIKEHSTIPVPEVYAIYSNPKENSHRPTNYIIMEHMPGESLQSCWSTLDDEAKNKIADQLRTYFVQLRNIPHQGYFGVVGNRPFEDGMFRPFDVTEINDTGSNDTDQKPSSGPFESEKEMIEAILSRYHLAYPKFKKCGFYTRHLPEIVGDGPQFSATPTFSGRMLSFGRTGLRC